MVLREAQVNDWHRLAAFLAELSAEERSYFSRHAALEVDDFRSGERFRKKSWTDLPAKNPVERYS